MSQRHNAAKALTAKMLHGDIKRNVAFTSVIMHVATSNA